MKLASNLSFLALATALLATPTASHATTVKKLSLRDLAIQAELIADAEVIAISHRNSDIVEAGDADLPHTFVTFAIHEAIKGRSSDGDRITLRFLGGPDGRGQVTVVHGAPEFRVGDRDLLFVRKNGETMCPVFGWERGRLRQVRGGVYDEHGREVWVTQTGDLALGEPRIDVRGGGYPSLAPQAPVRTDEHTRVFTPPPGAMLPNPSGMRAVIEQVLIEAGATGKLAEPVTVTSQDPSASFRALRMKAMAAPVDPVANPQRRPARPEDADR